MRTFRRGLQGEGGACATFWMRKHHLQPEEVGRKNSMINVALSEAQCDVMAMSCEVDPSTETVLQKVTTRATLERDLVGMEK